MLDWRVPITDLRAKIREARSRNETHANLDVLEKVLDEFSDTYEIVDLEEAEKTKLTDSPNKTEHAYLDKIVENQIKVLSIAYDKGSAYTNLVIGGGYATFFGLWSLTKDYLSSNDVMWSALLLSISAIFFVFFEVYKVLLTGYNLVKKSKATRKAKGMKTFEEQYEIIMKAEKDNDLANIMFIPIWAITASFAVIFACAGISLIFKNLISYLFNATT